MPPRFAPTTALLLATCMLLAGCGEGSSTSPEAGTPGDPKKDTLTIISTRPLGVWKPDSILSFEVVVRFALWSRDSATQKVGFNTLGTTAMFQIDPVYDSVVHRGAGEFRRVVSVHHREYTIASPFMVYMSLAPIPKPSTGYMPLASDQKVLIESE